ncbi:carcinoembryonic antigen-related cell adhesion molecule 8-like isoform X2 [Clupea harengus]|nr:carcinoembryonic antigen-related cell adhesion molecule 8-like isoform X2 [Clupea harengus]
MKFTINRPSAPFKEISWRFKSVPVITSMGGENITFGPGYPGRVRLNATTGSLELLNLTLEDSGLYTVTTRLGGGTELSGQTALTVLAPISNVSLVASATELIEYHSSVNISCTASGSVATLKLYGAGYTMTATGSPGKISSELYSVNYRVTRRDRGPYTCEASNAVSGAVVRTLTLNILYGPDEAIMVATPKGPSYHSGSDITLSCSSESKPAAQVQWALNGTLLGRERPELRLENVQASQSGAYSCWANNSKTGRNVQSDRLYVTVLEDKGVPGLSGGPIVAIVISALLAVAVLTAILLIVQPFFKKRCSQDTKRDQSECLPRSPSRTLF